MKNILLILMMSLMLFACSKEQNIPVRELDITVKSIDALTNTHNYDQKVTFYPNPFQEVVNLSIFSNDSAQVVIKYTDGETMNMVVEGRHRVSLDFNSEKSGVYYCEVLINETVFSTYLIKN